MKKIKYQGGLTKLITSKIGNKNKKRFARFIKQNLSLVSNKIIGRYMQIDIVSFSSTYDFYEQVLSILSFLRYVGTPASWTVYSDGSHTEGQVKLLESGFEFIKVEKIDWKNFKVLPDDCKQALLPYKDQLLDYASKLPLGKRLYYYLNHKIKNPTLFLDSDILFYNKASVFNLVLREKVNGWYLPDADWGCLDSRYKEKNSKQLYQVNGGFFIFNQELTDLKEGLDFLKSLNFKYEYFSDQNIFHILFRSNDFMPLDPRIFILNSADQFDFSYLYTREEMAIRHYTGPVRHKMWQRDWKWQLSLA
ncbi:MAG TPA: hypothetical protein VKC90_11445 [Chitinophagaceae bacterium]|nr:hypothetical protein [Chitinophagaceae bacterium]